MKKNNGISCQDNPFVRIKNDTTGITLVALVVTIVILLILAGITLIYVFGDNGIIKLAQQAKNETEDAMQREQNNLGTLANMLKEEYGNGTGGGNNNESGNNTTNPPDQPEPPGEEEIKKGEIVKEDKKEYTDENGDKAPIPGGFCVVDNSKEDPTDKNTVQNGLVISDVANDDLDNSKHGNQFVWVPVNDYSKFHLIEGYSGGGLQAVLSATSYPTKEAGDTATAGSPGKPRAVNSTAGSTESVAMYKSVRDNGGFYIARFEAGIVGTVANSSLLTATATDGTVKPLSQKGVGVWNYIRWGGFNTDHASDNLPGNDNADGAVKVARSMYEYDSTHKVTSTLCYGVQWDAALNFIDPNYESGTSTGYVKDSTGKGNYSSSLATTGSSTDYQQKHIYDMAGNVWEWTMEAGLTFHRVVRGGGCGDPVSGCPASCRGWDGPGISNALRRSQGGFISLTRIIVRGRSRGWALCQLS